MAFVSSYSTVWTEQDEMRVALSAMAYSWSIAKYVGFFPDVIKLTGQALISRLAVNDGIIKANLDKYVKPIVQPAVETLTYQQLKDWGRTYSVPYVPIYGEFQEFVTIYVPPEAPNPPPGYPAKLPFPVFVWTDAGLVIKLYKVSGRNFTPTDKELGYMMLFIQKWVDTFAGTGKYGYVGEHYDLFTYNSRKDGSGFSVAVMLWMYCQYHRREVYKDEVPATFNHLYGTDYSGEWAPDKVGVPWTGSHYKNIYQHYGHWKTGKGSDMRYDVQPGKGDWSAGDLDGYDTDHLTFWEDLNFTCLYAREVSGYEKFANTINDVSYAFSKAIASLIPIVGGYLSAYITMEHAKEAAEEQAREAEVRAKEAEITGTAQVQAQVIASGSFFANIWEFIKGWWVFIPVTVFLIVTLGKNKHRK